MKWKIYYYLVVLSLILLTGCSEPTSITCFIYKNAYDKTITIESFHLDGEKNSIKDSSFVIGPGEEHQVWIDGGMHLARPFGWLDGYIYSTAYVVVSDGEKQYVQKYDEGKLFYHNSYEVVIIKEKRHYVYTFTDKDFKDAIPIED